MQNCIFSQSFYPNLQIFLYGYIRHIRDILQLWACVAILGLDPLKAKDLIKSEDPKHMLFCQENAFVVIYMLFRDNISIP